MASFTIKDIENLTGIKAHTIRIWEQRYSFLKPGRTGTNIRMYSNFDLKKILNIALLNKYGYKISHINKMSEDEIREKIFLLNEAEVKQEYIVNQLIIHMGELDMYLFETVLNHHIKTNGIQKTITQIVFPFLEKIGILWLTNHISPAQEHLVSNIIRQKIISAIDSTPFSNSDKTVLLFLPEGEYHELGLLFINYLLRNNGIRTIYLGCSTPLNDVEIIYKLKEPDYLYCHLTTVCDKFNFDKFLIKISEKFPGTPIVFSGLLASAYKKKVYPPINFKKSYSEVIEFITTI